jgi:nitroreductase
MFKKVIVYLFVVAVLVACDSKTIEQREASDQQKSNAVVEAIMNRRSIRSYKPEQIKPDELDIILQCGINAPSARNIQPWSVRVVQSKEVLTKLNTDYINYTKLQNPEFSNRVPDYDVLFGAPTFVLIAGDTTEMYTQNDCGMLAQNMLLAAESMQIGSCVLGGIIRFINSPQGQEFRDMLLLPDNHRLFIGIVFGYKNETPDAKPRDASKVMKIK